MNFLFKKNHSYHLLLLCGISFVATGIFSSDSVPGSGYYSIISLYEFHYIWAIGFIIITCVSIILSFLFASIYIIKEKSLKILFSLIGIIFIIYFGNFIINEFNKNIQVFSYDGPCTIEKKVHIQNYSSIRPSGSPKSYTKYYINGISVRNKIIKNISSPQTDTGQNLNNMKCVGENISFQYSDWNGVYRDTIQFK